MSNVSKNAQNSAAGDNSDDYINPRANLKRHASDTDNDIHAKKHVSHANIVAEHYNRITEKDLRERFNSPIFYLRNFNNWVKSVLIQEYTDKIRQKDYGRRLKILDICCGKGGDLCKWQKAHVDHLICADIAEVSVEQCKSRYEDLRRRTGRLFTAEFIATDCTRNTLRDKYNDPSIKFDVVSCQFGLHYSFESLSQARCMLSNISECLKPGGYFIGTTTDAYEIISRSKKSPDGTFGNRIFNIELFFNPKEDCPLFGGKYNFHLDGVVDCPEFIVNFELLELLAKEYGLECVYKASFAEFYNEFSGKYRDLLHKIKCFENYPATSEKELIGEEKEYDHAKKYYENMENKNGSLGTMSQCEWDVASK